MTETTLSRSIREYFSLNLSIAFKDMLPKVGPDQVLPALVMTTGAKKKVKINVLSISEKI